jgi:hypothetical protein
MIEILIGIICIIPILVWAFSKNRIKPVYRRIIGAVAILLPIALYGLIFFTITHEPSGNFSKEKWNAKKTERWQMAGSLVKSKILMDKDSLQIKNILGPPDQRKDSLGQWYYDMGAGGGGLGFRFHSLLIIYRDGRVFKVEHQHIDD